MPEGELKTQTKRLAGDVLRFVKALPHDREIDVLARQLVRCGTSVGANYRAACRARSTRDFLSKMGIVEEESDEVLYWMELLKEAGYNNHPLFSQIFEEANHVLAMTVTSIRTARSRKGSR